MTSFYCWLAFAIVLACADLFLGTFYLIVIAGSALLVAFSTFLDLTLTQQMLLFCVAGLAGCFVFSRTRKKQQYQKIDDASKLQSIDIGREVDVKEILENGNGKVFYRGTVWDVAPASGHRLSKGVWVISGMNGNQLILKPKE